MLLGKCFLWFIGTFDDAELRISVLMTLSTEILIPFSEEVITYSEPVKTHKK